MLYFTTSFLKFIFKIHPHLSPPPQITILCICCPHIGNMANLKQPIQATALKSSSTCVGNRSKRTLNDSRGLCLNFYKRMSILIHNNRTGWSGKKKKGGASCVNGGSCSAEGQRAGQDQTKAGGIKTQGLGNQSEPRADLKSTKELPVHGHGNDTAMV